MAKKKLVDFVKHELQQYGVEDVTFYEGGKHIQVRGTFPNGVPYAGGFSRAPKHMEIAEATQRQNIRRAAQAAGVTKREQ